MGLIDPFFDVYLMYIALDALTSGRGRFIITR